MRCRHDSFDWYTCDGKLTYSSGNVSSVRCRCGHWLPLGPANNEPEAVQIEIQAADLVARLGPHPLASFDYEWHGEAGCLARIIHEHSEES